MAQRDKFRRSVLCSLGNIDMAKNIILAFVSPVSVRYLDNPIVYPDIRGRQYTAIQTNESAIVYVERMLGAESVSKIFLIASDSVKTQKVAPENEFGDVTHLEFLQLRIGKECPQLADKFSVHDYSESDDGLDALKTNILQTAEIADAVMKFANKQAADEIIVHADMTGGFRHASMLMLSIIQLLKYRGIKIGEVLYSDQNKRIVYSVTEIQRMFSLITGADEFVKFGSVEALNEYFGQNPPPVAKELLQAMNRFAEAIKICRTSSIEGELKNLGQHIKIFREHPDKDIKSELFAKIIDTVEHEYSKLIGPTVERLEIIRWCMRKSFWQQALTLCTEWLPEEIVARRICRPCDVNIIQSCESKARAQKRTWQQYFIIEYKVVDKSGKESDIKIFCDKLRGILKHFPSRKIGDEEIFGELRKFFDEYNRSNDLFERCKCRAVKVKDFKQSCPTLVTALQAIYDKQLTNIKYKKNFYEFLLTIDFAKIPILVSKFPNEKILELFKIDRDKIQAFKLTVKPESKWDMRAKAYRQMFAMKLINLRPDLETALEILRGYHELRDERNQINHANAQASKTVSELKPMIEKYLTALERAST